MHHVCPHRQWQDRTEPGGQEIIPGACPGFVVDHIKPLKRGGADAPGNMQWQTTAAAKAKDKIE
jgi:hypothetical protein